MCVCVFTYPWRHPQAVWLNGLKVSIIFTSCVIACLCIHAVVCWLLVSLWRREGCWYKEALPISTQAHIHTPCSTSKYIYIVRDLAVGSLLCHNLVCKLTMMPSSGRPFTGRSLMSPPPRSVLSQLLWGDSGGGWYRMLANRKKTVPKT